MAARTGAVLYWPQSRETETLGEPPPDEFVRLLRQRNVEPLSVGQVIVATWEPHGHAVPEAIRMLGLELQVIFNKGAVMVLPSGVNKAVGLDKALFELGLSRHNTVGVGDAENDHAFLRACECSAAVANALEMVKVTADAVTAGHHGEGVIELIDRLLETDLGELAPVLRRHIRKYAEGELLEEERFVFRGPEGRLNLVAHNLTTFLRLADGVDDDTWLYHLGRGDYSRWFRKVIKDPEMADEAEAVERTDGLSAEESRRAIRDLVERRYTLLA